MTVSSGQVSEDIVARIKIAMAAFSAFDASGLSEHLSDQVVFGSPSTEWVGDCGWTQGKNEVIQRFALERRYFSDLELVEILVSPGRATVMLRDGPRMVTCLVELDAEGRFSRLISFFMAPPGETIACPEGSPSGDERDEAL